MYSELPGWSTSLEQSAGMTFNISSTSTIPVCRRGDCWLASERGCGVLPHVRTGKSKLYGGPDLSFM